MRASGSTKDTDAKVAGQRAALFPALSEGSREKRAVSILLACMEQVPELARSLLQGQGAPFGKTSRLEAWTEAGPIGKKGADRPDGRIEVTNSRGQKWIALLEAKIGKAAVESAQIDGYLAEARAAGASALITVSNDFAVLPSHHTLWDFHTEPLVGGWVACRCRLRRGMARDVRGEGVHGRHCARRDRDHRGSGRTDRKCVDEDCG